MISLLQKTRLISRILCDQLRAGQPPSLTDALEEVSRELQGRGFGTPLTRIRPAVAGREVGGKRGVDLWLTFTELRQDLEVLYQGLLQLATGTVDLYHLFAVRRDRLSLKLADYRTQTLTRLAQVQAGSRLSASDSFNTLDRVDLTRSTVSVDLLEGVATLPADNRNSLQYDAQGLVVRGEWLNGQAAPQSPGQPDFARVFNPYRVDAWYRDLPPGATYEVQVNVTGADYEAESGEEILLNALQVEPTSALYLQVDWSPEGYNWHPLDPPVGEVLRERRTFHFSPVQVGYLRFRLSHAEPVATARPLGLKRIGLLKRGFTSSAVLYSLPWVFSERVHSVVTELETQVPLGTRLQGYLARSEDGPWYPVREAPLTFGTIQWTDPALPLLQVAAETRDGEPTATPTRFWETRLNLTQQPLPESGELLAGTGQLELSGYAYNWQQRQERDHLPTQEDWSPPLAEARRGPFTPYGDLASLTDTAFTDGKSPFAYATDASGQTYLVTALLQEDESFVLQPGYNYRIRAFLYANQPVTLLNQRIGLVNQGGATSHVLAAFSVYLNGGKVYSSTACVAAPEDLGATTHQYSLPLEAGWNSFEILLQLPNDLPDLLEAGDILGTRTLLYFQPNLFDPQLAGQYGISPVRAYREPWTRLTEFGVRYNSLPGETRVWAWKQSREPETEGNLLGVLFNHDPMNGRSEEEDGSETPLRYIDGVNAAQRTDLALRYAVDTSAAEAGDQEGRALYFRADLVQEPGASGPPVLFSYRLLVN
jgi:hypothetical protein